MLVVVCLLLNVLILAYLGKKGWKGIYNVYLSFVALMALMSIFFVDIPEVEESLEDFFGTKAYSYLDYMITGNSFVGVSPLFAIALASFVIAAILISYFAFESIKRLCNISGFIKIRTNSQKFFSFACCSKKIILRKYAVFCTFLC